VVKIYGKFDGLRENTLRQGREELKILLKNNKSEYTIQDFIKPSFDYKSFSNEVKVGETISI